MDPLLDVKHLSVDFTTRAGSRRVVDDVSIQIDSGKTLGVVGESGSGKTTLGRSILRLIEPVSGSVQFDGREITKMSSRQLRPLRASMQIVFQDSAGSLNPRKTVGDILVEPLLIHAVGDRGRRIKLVAELLDRVRLPRASIHRFPHEFSGGQRQRINIARAIALQPKLIICDEPVSALDVSVQAQILNLLRDLQRDLGLTYLFISHDLAVVRYMSDDIAVMHRGQIVETGNTAELFAHPKHDYTRTLLASIPSGLPMLSP